MKLEELRKMKEITARELEVAEKKQKELEKLSNEVEEEVNARRGFIFNIDRLIALQK